MADFHTPKLELVVPTACTAAVAEPDTVAACTVVADTAAAAAADTAAVVDYTVLAAVGHHPSYCTVLHLVPDCVIHHPVVGNRSAVVGSRSAVEYIQNLIGRRGRRSLLSTMQLGTS